MMEPFSKLELEDLLAEAASLHINIPDFSSVQIAAIVSAVRRSTSSGFDLVQTTAEIFKCIAGVGWTDPFAHTAVIIARYLAAKNGSDLAIASIDDPSFRNVREELQATGRLTGTSLAWISSRLDVLAQPEAIAEQLALPGLERAGLKTHSVSIGPAVPLQPRAYVASPLTNAAGEEMKAIEALSDRAAGVLARFGVLVHQPVLHTHPSRQAALTPAEVHRRDAMEVANSDLLVVLATKGSTGVGKEISWAESSRVPYIVLYPEGVEISRLLLGTPFDATFAQFQAVDEIEGLLDHYLCSYLPTVHRHAEVRARRERDHLERWARLRQRLLEAGADPQQLGQNLVPPERLCELMRSPSHFAGATLDELAVLERLLPGEAVSPDTLDLVRSSLSSRELTALEDARDIESWSLEECIHLAAEACRLNQSAGLRRFRLTNASDWRDFRRSSRG